MSEEEPGGKGSTKAKLRAIGKLIIPIIIIMICLSVVMMIANGYHNMNSMCWLRYAIDSRSGALTGTAIVASKSFDLNANGNYETVTINSSNYSTYAGDGSSIQSCINQCTAQNLTVCTCSDPSGWGKWVNAGSVGNPSVSRSISLTVTGSVSLCKSYLPYYDVQTGLKPPDTVGTGVPYQNIPIPRIEDQQTLALRFPANTREWRNVAEVFIGDQIQVYVGPAYDSTNLTTISKVQMPDAFTNNKTTPADCSPGVNPADPICGRVSPFAGGYKYINACNEPATVNYPAGCYNSCGYWDDSACHWNWDGNTGGHCDEHEGCGMEPLDVNAVRGYLKFGTDVYHDGCGWTGIKALPSTDPASINAYITANVVTWGPSYVSVSSPLLSPPEAYNPAIPGNVFPNPGASGTAKITSANFSNYYHYYSPNYNTGPGAAPTCSTYNPNYTGATTSTKMGPAGMRAIVNKYYFWLANGNGLVARLDADYVSKGDISPSVSVKAPTNKTTLGSNFTPLTPISAESSNNITIAASNTLAYATATSTTGGVLAPGGQKIYTGSYTSADISSESSNLLQFRYLDYGTTSSFNTGGYVLYINHTKCKRSNGKFFDDVITARGKIEYYIIPTMRDPNVDSSSTLAPYQSGFLDLNSNNTISLDIDSDKFIAGDQPNLWLKIKNYENDYQDSAGKYTIQFNTREPVGLFTNTVIMPLIKSTTQILHNAGSQIFANLTCHGAVDQSKCFDFFKYIRALLTLYVFMFGAMFLLGKVEIDREDVFNRMIKITIIAGLINGTTFDFMQESIIPGILGFPAQMIANFDGFSPSDPFSFLDDVLSKILLNKLTVFQLLTLLSFGITGVAMFLITCIAILIFLAATLQVICTYIFAMMLVAFLLGLTPFFLVFMLFETTKSLFQKWCNSIFRYMLEPTVALIGLAILTSLYAYYLDHVLSYSVCFKCAIPFKVPTIYAFIPSMPSQFKSIYLFCFYWFGAWGVDHSTGLASISMPDIIGLGIIAFISYTYVGVLVPAITSALTNSMGSGASAGQMGSQAGNKVAQGVKYAAGKAVVVAKVAAKPVMMVGGMIKKAVMKGKGGKGGGKGDGDKGEEKGVKGDKGDKVTKGGEKGGKNSHGDKMNDGPLNGVKQVKDQPLGKFTKKYINVVDKVIKK